MRLQSSLGRKQEDSRSLNHSANAPVPAEVVAVNYEHGTVDVKLLRNGDLISGGDNPQLSCKILKSNGGTDPESGTYWGEQHPIAIGDYVVVGYLEGRTNRPFIMGFIDNTEKDQNLMEPTMQPQEQDKLKYLKVYPNQTYFKIDNLGNTEQTHLNGFETSTDKDLDDNFSGTTEEHLSEKNKTSGKTLGLESTLKNVLKVVKTAGGGLVKYFIGKDGSTRFSHMMTGGKTTFIEFNPDGSFKLRKQVDSDGLNSGSNYTQTQINPDGSITTTRNSGGVVTESTINADGSTITSVCSGKCTFSVGTDGSITVNSESGLTANTKGAVSLTSNTSVQVTAPKINLN